MAISEQARKNHDELFPGHTSTLTVTDPELIEVFDNFAFDEVLQHGSLDPRTRLMVQLSAYARMGAGALARRGLSVLGRSETQPARLSSCSSRASAVGKRMEGRHLNMPPGLIRAFNRHRNERASELFEIANLLDQENLTPDAGPIRQAAGQCLAIRTVGGGQTDSGRRYWGYDIADLQINLEDQRHVRPRSAVVSGMTGILTIAVQEYLPESESQICDSYALLRRLSIDFYVDGVQIIEDVEHPLRAAWHLDTHLYPMAMSRAVHPRFHFQIGGERLDCVDKQIRGVLMPEAPRIPCAPFDAILAVDFILAQYCGERWNRLRDIEPRYGRLRKNPMKRYWSPYFRILADCIDNLDYVPTGGAASTLIPNIFVAEERRLGHSTSVG